MLFSLSQIFENNFLDYGIVFPISYIKMYSPCHICNQNSRHRCRRPLRLGQYLGFDYVSYFLNREHICNRNTRLFLKCIYFSRYQINARTELARKYKNVSPLENHHAAMAFEILSRPECNIFSGMTSKETEAVHNVIYFNTFSSTYT